MILRNGSFEQTALQMRQEDEEGCHFEGGGNRDGSDTGNL